MDQNKYDGDVSHLNAYYTESFPAFILSGNTGNTDNPILYSWNEMTLDDNRGYYSGCLGGRTGVANAREIQNQDVRLWMPFYTTLNYEGIVSGNPFYSFDFGWQTQATVQVLASGQPASGRIYRLSKDIDGSFKYSGQQYCWIDERSNRNDLLQPGNDDNLKSGHYYPAQLVQLLSGTVSGFLTPVYAVSERELLDGGFIDADPATDLTFVSGLSHLRFASGDFYLSGYQQSGSLNVYIVNKLDGAFIDADPADPTFTSGITHLRFASGDFYLSGYTQSGTLEVFAANKLNAVNTDNTNPTSGLIQINVHNSFSGYPNARLLWTDLSASGVSGQGQLDWQGLRLYQSGTGFVGPAPDIALVPGSGISTTIESVSGNMVQLTIAATAKVSGITVETLNTDGTQDANPTTTILANNTFSGNQYGRLIFTSSGNANQLDWQGIQAYQAGFGSVGPAPDLEFIAGNNISIGLSGDTSNSRIQVKIDSSGGAITSGSLYWYYFVSGALPATINRNATEFVYPTILLVGDNSYSGHQFGRIMFSDASGGATSYTNISGDTTGLISPLPYATQLDWQGQRVYHQGNGWFGPQPDLQLVDTDTVTWSGGVDATTQTLLLQANLTRPPAAPLYTTSNGTYAFGDLGGSETLVASVVLPATGVFRVDAFANGSTRIMATTSDASTQDELMHFIVKVVSPTLLPLGSLSMYCAPVWPGDVSGGFANASQTVTASFVASGASGSVINLRAGLNTNGALVFTTNSGWNTLFGFLSATSLYVD